MEPPRGVSLHLVLHGSLASEVTEHSRPESHHAPWLRALTDVKKGLEMGPSVDTFLYDTLSRPGVPSCGLTSLPRGIVQPSVQPPKSRQSPDPPLSSVRPDSLISGHKCTVSAPVKLSAPSDFCDSHSLRTKISSQTTKSKETQKIFWSVTTMERLTHTCLALF